MSDELAVDVQDAFCLHPLPDGGAVAALRGLTLAVAAGERLVVHGPNGSGKTTLMRALVGEQRLAAGSAVVAGLNLAGAGPRQLAAWRATSLGQVDQDAGRLLRDEFDVLDNVALQLRVARVPRALARDRAREILDRLGLAELAGRRPGTLSGGQRQRVAVCAALAHGPRLVLADEPTGELDLESADVVYDLLATAVAAAGASLVLVTHDRRAGQIADRVVRIRDGRISETWRPERHPDAEPPARESLVLDSRGWMRIPIDLRRRLGLGAQLTVQADGEALVLRADHDRPPARPESAPAPTPPELRLTKPTLDADRASIAEASGIVVRYNGRPALDSPAGDGVHLAVRPAEVVVIAGRSGAGKSTLLRVLLGLQRPDAGRVRLAGVDLAGCDRAELAAVRAGCSAVVMQQIQLAATADAIGNLDLARSARGLPPDPALVGWQLERLGLTGLARRPVSGLSGGERQRLAVARALAVGPALLVLDEPTSQLDEASAEMLTAVLREVADAGTAIVTASHDPVLIAVADHTYRLT
jgi:energy-coupling factor transport system ATP-binding protein